VNETEARLSIVYFSNPLPHSIMSVPHKLIDREHPLEFRPAFTWLDYKTHLLETHKNQHHHHHHHNNNNGGRTSKSWLLRRKINSEPKVNLNFS
jgi:gibberellin 20-oxidase